MGIYERIKEVSAEKGYSINKLEKELGLPRSSISKYNKNVPSMDKIRLISDFLGVSIDYLMYGKESDGYYLNYETAQIAQEIFDDPNLRALFSAARGVKPEQMKLAEQMLRQFKETNPDA